MTINDPESGLKAQIQNTEKSLSDNTESQTKQTASRTEDNLAYQQDVKNLVKAQSILSKAIKVLKTYYDDMEKQLSEGLNVSLMQAKKEDPNAPADSLHDDHAGQSSQGNAVLKMLNFILGETNKEEMKAHADEEKAQAEYEDEMQSLKNQEAKDQKLLGKLQETLAGKEKDLIDANEDLADTTK